jgi:hypothetical protein
VVWWILHDSGQAGDQVYYIKITQFQPVLLPSIYFRPVFRLDLGLFGDRIEIHLSVKAAQ